MTQYDAFDSSGQSGGRPDIRYVVGGIYNRRRDIHGQHRGQQQGGISTPSNSEFVFLFTGDAGGAYGYKDEFRPDGVYWYTGEGQIGDMNFVRGNRAIRDHQKDGKTLLMFEDRNNGSVQFAGVARYLGHHHEERPDINGNNRKAIVFELAMDSSPEVTEPTYQVAEPLSKEVLRKLWRIPLADLKEEALRKASKAATSQERRENIYRRSEAVRIYVLRRAAGKCEFCEATAPFKTNQGKPYLEPHHLRRLADGGPDHPSSVIALCPNCHRRAHYSSDSEEVNEQCSRRVKQIEND